MTLSAFDRATLLTRVQSGSFDDLRKLLADMEAGNFPGLTATGVSNLLGLVLTPYAATATADGTGTGTIPDAAAFVTVTASDANHIITLPAPTVGKVIVLRNGATGYELRSSTPASIAINGGSGANAESAIAANTMVIAVCTTATTWQAIGLAGTTLAAVAAAAA